MGPSLALGDLSNTRQVLWCMEWKHQVMMITEILQTRRDIKEVKGMDIAEPETKRIVAIMTSHYGLLRVMFAQMGGDMDALQDAIRKQNLESE